MQALRAEAKPPLIYLVGNKCDLVHLRRVTPADHLAFMTSNGLAGGFFVSARTGDGVLLAMYSAAAAVTGVELSAVDRAEAEKVVTVIVARGDDADARRTADADKIEAEDAAAAAAQRDRRARPQDRGGCGCAVM